VGAVAGAVDRLGEVGEDDGVEKPREPRLPPEDPPPARAHAVSPVRSGMENTAVVVVSTSAIVAAESWRFMSCSSVGAVAPSGVLQGT
jgi:hypothetical protein